MNFLHQHEDAQLATQGVNLPALLPEAFTLLHPVPVGCISSSADAGDEFSWLPEMRMVRRIGR